MGVQDEISWLHLVEKEVQLTCMVLRAARLVIRAGGLDLLEDQVGLEMIGQITPDTIFGRDDARLDRTIVVTADLGGSN